MSIRAPMPLVIAAIALVTVGLLALGVWQLQRHSWKQDLVAERNARLDTPPVDAAALLDEPRDTADWRRVSATGRWDHEHTMIVTNRIRFGRRGEEVVTPLLLGEDQPALLVDRGWYPLDERERVLSALRAEDGATVTGLARAVGDGGGHTIPNGTWNRVDARAMARALPYPAAEWLVIQGQRVEEYDAGDGSLPVQQYTGFVNTTPHLEYAFTWFGLAIALVVIACVRFVVSPLRARQAARHGPDEPRRAPDDTPGGAPPGRPSHDRRRMRGGERRR